MDVRIATLAGNSLLLAAAVVAWALALGLPLAVLLYRTDLPGSRFWRLAWMLALVLPLHVHATAWLAAFGVQGWVTSQLWPATTAGRWAWTIALQGAAALPWAILLCGLGLRLVEPDLEEWALLDGPTWSVLRRVTLPRAREACFAGALWLGASVAGEMTITDLFSIRTLAEEVYTQHALGGPAIGRSYLLQITLPAAALLLAALLVGRAYQPRPLALSHRRAPSFMLGRARLAALGLVAAVTAGIAGMPLLALLGRAGLERVRLETGWQTHWSPSRAAWLVLRTPLEFQREFTWSFISGLLAASVATGVAVLLAWMARAGGWRSVLAWFVVALCGAVPGPLLGKALIALFNDDAWFAGSLRHWLYDRTIAALVAAQAVRALPIAMLVLWAALRAVPTQLLETSALDGFRPGMALVRLILPAQRGALALAWMGAFVGALGELPASLLVAPPGVTTLAMRIFELIHFGVDDRVAAICLVLVLGAGVMGYAGLRLLERTAET